MTKESIKKRIDEAIAILKALGLPRAQQNERSGLTLLALLDLKPESPWSAAQSPMRGITEMMNYFEEHYEKKYAPNSRETVRRFTVHQFVQAGLVEMNSDNLQRPVNSPQSVYRVEKKALELIRLYNTTKWDDALHEYLVAVETLQQRYAKARDMQRIPVQIAPNQTISLSPGGQNVLVKAIIEDFCSYYTPNGKLLYIGDAGEKWAYFDRESLSALGVQMDSHGKMPDVVVHFTQKNWLILIEAVTSHGPIDHKRHDELKKLFAAATVGIVFVTAFLTRRGLSKYLSDVSWETEVWVAESPTHLIHFNGERFLGPY